MALEKIRMRFTFNTENGKPIIRSWPIDTALRGFVVDLEGDKIEDIVTEVLSYAYEKHNHFSEGYAAVMRHDKWGMVDLGLQEVIEPEYDDITFLHEGFAVVKSGLKYGYLNMRSSANNHKCTDLKFDKAFDFRNGMAIVKMGEKYGFVANTKTNELAIPCIYDEVRDFGHPYPYAAVKFEGKYGMIDKSGNFVITPQFDSFTAYDSQIEHTKIRYNAKIGEKFYYIEKDASVREL